MKKAVLILAWRRPECLYVCLDSLFRNDLSGWDVWIYVDAEGGEESDIVDMASSFDTEPVQIRSIRLRNLLHTTFSIKDLVDKGYDRIFYLENDILLRTDTFDYLKRAKYDCFFLNMMQKWKDRDAKRRNMFDSGINLSRRNRQIIKAYREGKPKDKVLHQFGGSDICNRYTPLGNVVDASDFNKLFDFIISGRYIKQYTGNGIIDTLFIKGHDNMYNLFLQNRGFCTRHSDRNYTLHFGIKSEQEGHSVSDSAGKLYNKMFSGAKEGWIDNVIRIAHENRYPEVRKLTPKGFRYET